MDILPLVAGLHRDALTRLARKANKHVEGLQQGCRAVRLSSRWARRLRELEACYGLIRHITEFSAASFLAELDLALEEPGTVELAAKRSGVGNASEASEEAPVDLCLDVAAMLTLDDAPACASEMLAVSSSDQRSAVDEAEEVRGGRLDVEVAEVVSFPFVQRSRWRTPSSEDRSSDDRALVQAAGPRREQSQGASRECASSVSAEKVWVGAPVREQTILREKKLK